MCRIIALFDESDEVSKNVPENIDKKLTENDTDGPWVNYSESVKKMEVCLVEETGTKLDVSTILQVLHHLGVKKSISQGSDVLRALYLVDIFEEHPEVFVIVDKMGVKVWEYCLWLDESLQFLLNFAICAMLM